MEKVESDTITLTDTSQIAKDLAALYLNKKFSDVTLVVDGTELHAHGVKNMLIFLSNTQKKNRLFYLHEVNILRPCYTTKIRSSNW